MFCPNYKNKEVFDGFNEIIEAFGGEPMTEDEFRSADLRKLRSGLNYSAMEAAYRVYNRNGGNFLDKTPSGDPSILFQELLEKNNGDRKKAIAEKSYAYSLLFFKKFGNWISDSENKVSLDLNKEPLISYFNTTDDSNANTTLKYAETAFVKRLLPASVESIFGENWQLAVNGEYVQSNVIINNLIDNKLVSEENESLANILSRHNIPIKLDVLPSQKIAATITEDSKTSVIVINKEYIGTVTTEFLSNKILHEIVHAVTVPAIDNPTTLTEHKFSKSVADIYSFFDGILDKTDRYDIYTGSYVMENAKEFAAVFATDDVARKWLYKKALSFDKSLKNRFINKLKTLINNTVGLLSSKFVIDNKTAKEKLDYYKRQYEDYLYNRPAINITENVEDVLNAYYSQYNINTRGNDFQNALLSAEILSKGIQVNYAAGINNTFDTIDIARTLMTRLQLILRSELDKDEIARQSQLIESQVRLIISSDYETKILAMRMLAEQLGPLINDDYRKLRKVPKMNAEEYMTSMHINIGAYKKLANMCSTILGDQNWVSLFLNSAYKGKDKSTPEGKVEYSKFKQRLFDEIQRLTSTFNQIEHMANDCSKILDYIRTKSVRDLMLTIKDAVGDPDIDDYIAKLNKIDFDTPDSFANFRTADSSIDAGIRTLAYLVNGADIKTQMDTNKVAIKLAKAYKKLNKRQQMQLLFELDHNNNKTGWLIRKRNYGVFYDEYNAEIRRINLEINKKYGLNLKENNRLAPQQKDARKEWNTMRNTWLKDHCNRKYKDEYYDAQAELSTEALLRMQSINSQIYQINMLPGVIRTYTVNGKTVSHADYYNLTDEQFDKLQMLITKKKFLRSKTDEFGHTKTESELAIAEEIDNYYKKIYEDKPNKLARDKKSWEEIRTTIFNECGGQEEYDKMKAKQENTFDKTKWDKWNERNSKLSFKLDSDGKPLVFKLILRDFGEAKPYYGEEEEKIQKEINDRLKVYYGTNMLINDEAITKSAKNAILNLIKKQIQLKQAATQSSPSLKKQADKYGSIFNKYIEFVTTEKYNKLAAEAVELASENGYLDEDLLFDLLSEYATILRDWDTYDVVGVRPHRWYSKMQAKDVDRWMEWTPGDAYIDMENSSSILNPDFDDSEGVSYVPKENKYKQYDNTKNFAKVSKTAGYENQYDENLANLYDVIKTVIANANGKMKNKLYVDNYLLPQISGSILTRMLSNKAEGKYWILRKFNIFTEWFKEKFGIDNEQSQDDPRLGEDSSIKEGDFGADTQSYIENIQDVGLLRNMPDDRSMHIIPLYFTQRKNPQYLSNDLLGIVMSYYTMASNYENKLAIKDKCEMIVDMISARNYNIQQSGSRSIDEYSGKESNAYKFAQKFLEMNLYDIRRERSKNILGMTVYTRALDLLKDYTTANNLGMNPKVSIVGLLTSQYNHFINSISGNGYGFMDATYGGIEAIWSIVRSLIYDNGGFVGNIDSNDKQMVIAEYYNVAGQQDRKLKNSHLNRAAKTAKLHTVFGFMSMLDYISKSAIANSVLHSFRYMDGKFVTVDMLKAESAKIEKSKRKKWLEDKLDLYKTAVKLFNVITPKNGEFYIEDEQYRKAYDESTHHIVYSRIEKLAERSDGMTTKTQKAAITQGIAGSLILVHRQYLPIMLEERFGREIYDYDMHMMKNGLMSLILNFCKDLAKTNVLYASGVGAFGSFIMLQNILGPLSSLIGAAAGALYYQKQKKNKTTKNIKEVYNKYFNNESTEGDIIRSMYHKRILKQVATELLMYHIILSPVINTICKAADDDRDNWWLLFAALCLRLFWWEAYTPYRFDDVLNTFKTVSAATGTLDYLEYSLGGLSYIGVELLELALLNTLEIPTNPEDLEDNHINKKVKSGVYKNWNKVLRDIYNTIPIHNIYKQGFYAPIPNNGELFGFPVVDSGGAIGPYKMRKYSENQIMKIDE